MTKQSTPNYKLDDKVFVHTVKQDGKIESINREQEYAVVKILNRKSNKPERIEVKFNNISPYIEKQPRKYNPNEMYWMVHEFHKAFGHPISDKPQPLDLERGTSRAIWAGEEALVEFIHQTSNNEEEFLLAYDHLIVGLEKAKQKSLGLEYPKSDVEKVVGQADALTDALYFIFGSFVEMGIKPFNLFKIVQEANMSKLFPDGKPRYRDEDGKIMKPDTFIAPEPRLTAEVERQSK